MRVLILFLIAMAIATPSLAVEECNPNCIKKKDPYCAYSENNATIGILNECFLKFRKCNMAKRGLKPFVKVQKGKCPDLI